MQNEDVNKAWDSLEGVLREVAPKTFSTLRMAAPEEDFKALEQELGFALPEEFFSFYRRHNGEAPTDEASDGLFEWGYWMPLVSANQENVLESYSMCKESYALSTPQDFDLRFNGPVRARAFDSKWVPFCTDYSGNYLCFDFNPPARGTYGQILFCDYDGEGQISVIAASLADLVSQLTDDVRTGKRVIEERGFLETTIRIPNVKERVIDSILQTPTLKEMGLVLRILDPNVVNDPPSTAHFLRRPDVETERCVAFSVYSDVNPCEKVLEGHGGDAQVVESGLFHNGERLNFGDSGTLHRRYDEKYFCLLPIFYLTSLEKAPSDAVLEVTVRRRKRLPI